jgi:hypothetical protein
LNPAEASVQRRILGRWGLRGYLLTRLPLGLWAGLRVRSLDDAACTVSLPGGWRTRNPFGSTYFAAQLMAAEMSTGAPAMMLVSGASASVALILIEIRGTFTKKILGESLYTFSDVAGMREAVERAAAGSEAVLYTGRPVGRTSDGNPASEFEVTWSFKRRGAKDTPEP